MKILLFIFYVIPIWTFSQNLENHQWKDRILLVMADAYENDTFSKQIYELSKDKVGLLERKLLVYQVCPSSYFLGLKKGKAIPSSTFYDRFNTDKKPFKIILIGLDGDVKKESTSFMSANDIFATIDQMPIRRQELRLKNN